jgi:hypothetical protein
MGAYGEKGGVPRVVRDCVTYLRGAGKDLQRTIKCVAF